MKFHRLVIQALALMAVNHHASFEGHSRGLMLASAQEDVAEEVPPRGEPEPEDTPAEPAADDTAAAVDEEEATKPDEYKPPENAENYEFQAEVHRMLDIVVNSLYQNKDVFLRELISNASDALDKFRYLTLTEGGKYQLGDVPLKIELDYNEELNTLTIRDTGIGMTHDEMVKNLGTVARSGTTKFMETLKSGESEDKELLVDQIGQFGVGFYSAFLVADRVAVASRSASSNEQFIWESVNGESNFHIYPDPRGSTLQRGTEITLHLKDDARLYASPNKISELTKHFSEFVVHPIFMKKIEEEEVEDEDAEEEEKKTEEEDELEMKEDEEDKPKKMKTIQRETWEELNTRQALWTREADSISDDEYQAFWHVLNGDEFTNSSHWTHFNAEGNINFKSLLYLPSEVPAELRTGSIDHFKSGVRLYVHKVLISDSFELMPRYLSFIKGVVDSDDLPLNVNRETLQESKIIKIIQKKLVRKALDMIKAFSKEKDVVEEEEEEEAEIDADGTVREAKKKDSDKDTPWTEWYKKFSTSLKLGILEDQPNQKRLMKLLRFESNKSNGKLISFDDYIADMKDWQEEIYMLAGTDAEAIKKSPFMDPFIEKDVDVLFLTEPIDEYVFAQIRDYEDKKFTDISREDVKFKDEDEDLQKRREKAYRNKFKPLTKWLKKLYGNSIMRVALSYRLGQSPAIVSSSRYGNSANMERIMRAQTLTHGEGPQAMSMKVFEINPRHPIVVKLLEGSPPEDAEEGFEPSDEIKNAAWLLHDMAMLNGGYPIQDPKKHNARLTKFMQSQLGLESLSLEPPIDPPEEEEEAPEFDMDAMGDMGGINLDDFDLGDMDLD